MMIERYMKYERIHLYVLYINVYIRRMSNYSEHLKYYCNLLHTKTNALKVTMTVIIIQSMTISM